MAVSPDEVRTGPVFREPQSTVSRPGDMAGQLSEWTQHSPQAMERLIWCCQLVLHEACAGPVRDLPASMEETWVLAWMGRYCLLEDGHGMTWLYTASMAP